MKYRLPFFFLIAILFAGIGIYFGINKYASAPPAESAAAQLMAASLPDARGDPVALAQFKGRPVVVNFWATWCPPCVDEMPELNALQNELGAEKVQIVGIAIDSPSNIAEFATKQKIAYPLLVGGMGGTEMSRQLGNKAGGLPFTVLLDRDGVVKKQYLGRLKMETLRRDLQSL